MTADLVAFTSPWGPICLEANDLRCALERGRGLFPAPDAQPEAAPERLMTAAELAAATSVPQSWWEAAARRGEVPCRLIGRYPRFVWSEILECEAFKGRSA